MEFAATLAGVVCVKGQSRRMRRLLLLWAAKYDIIYRNNGRSGEQAMVVCRYGCSG